MATARPARARRATARFAALSAALGGAPGPVFAGPPPDPFEQALDPARDGGPYGLQLGEQAPFDRGEDEGEGEGEGEGAGEDEAPGDPAPSAPVAPPTPRAGPAPEPAPPAPRPGPPEPEPPRKAPRLSLGVFAVIGPHDPGDEECRLTASRSICDRTGQFFGLGGSVELRARVVGVFAGHVRLHAVGNVAGVDSADPAWSGLLSPRAGLGAYGRWAWIRLELGAPFMLGSGRHRIAGIRDDFTRAEWGALSGGLEGALRLPLRKVTLESVGGLVLGPRIERETDEGRQRRFAVTFTVGLGVAFDLIP